jgi:S1-C subfamily serine protease
VVSLPDGRPLDAKERRRRTLENEIWSTCHDSAVNLLDVVIVVVVLLAAANGFRRGAALQLTTYVGLLAGLLVGALVAPKVAGAASSPLGRAALSLVVLLGLAAVGDGIGWAIGTRVWVAARRTVLGKVDSVAGTVVAMVAVLATVWFLGWNLANGPFPSLSSEIRGSAIVRGLDGAFPRPPSIFAEVRQLLNRFGFPEVFEGLPPAPVGPVQGPTQGEAAALAKKVEASTVRIVGQACNAIQEGSGFVVAPNYVLTNAHVVAGVRSPQVQQQNGLSQSATTVLFNPRMDVAILRVNDSPGKPLPLDGQDVGRGTKGAVLGFPGGGRLTVGTAAVRRDIEAMGRDIYGRAVVQRDVYELQATVRPGNSGGPFVLFNGDVAGVVFAASTTDSNIGYALTTPQIIPLVQQVQGKTGRVSTDGCTG